MFRFEYGLGDIAAASGLDGPSVGPGLLGVVIDMASKASTDQAARIGGFGDGLRLDFGAGRAYGFCFDASDGSEDDALAACIRGGGSSSGIEASLTAAPIPLPATLPLALGGLGALALRPRRRRAA